jgi:sporulation protein YlmC with PRC-barrel domain
MRTLLLSTVAALLLCQSAAIAGTNTTAAGQSTATGAATTVASAVPKNDNLSSNLIGLDVYNGSNQNIGQIKDIAIGPQGRVQAYIVSVGGFLGMDERYVAVNPLDIKVSYNDSEKKWQATMNATADQLKRAPRIQVHWSPESLLAAARDEGQDSTCMSGSSRFACKAKFEFENWA